MGEKKWYVLRTAGGKEKKAKEYLEKEVERSGLQNQVSQILVPVEKKYKVKNGKRVQTESLLYSGYVFIEADLTPELQYVVRNLIPGMSGFLTEKTGEGVNERIPVPLREDDVRNLLGRQDVAASGDVATEVDYEIGQSVKITDGPFTGFDGTVDDIIEERSKIKVIVMIFGRKTVLELSFNQVTKE